MSTKLLTGEFEKDNNVSNVDARPKRLRVKLFDNHAVLGIVQVRKCDSFATG